MKGKMGKRKKNWGRGGGYDEESEAWGKGWKKDGEEGKGMGWGHCGKGPFGATLEAGPRREQRGFLPLPFIGLPWWLRQ